MATTSVSTLLPTLVRRTHEKVESTFAQPTSTVKAVDTVQTDSAGIKLGMHGTMKQDAAWFGHLCTKTVKTALDYTLGKGKLASGGAGFSRSEQALSGFVEPLLRQGVHQAAGVVGSAAGLVATVIGSPVASLAWLIPKNSATADTGKYFSSKEAFAKIAGSTNETTQWILNKIFSDFAIGGAAGGVRLLSGLASAMAGVLGATVGYLPIGIVHGLAKVLYTFTPSLLRKGGDAVRSGGAVAADALHVGAEKVDAHQQGTLPAQTSTGPSAVDKAKKKIEEETKITADLAEEPTKVERTADEDATVGA